MSSQLIHPWFVLVIQIQIIFGISVWHTLTCRSNNYVPVQSIALNWNFAAPPASPALYALRNARPARFHQSLSRVFSPPEFQYCSSGSGSQWAAACCLCTECGPGHNAHKGALAVWCACFSKWSPAQEAFQFLKLSCGSCFGGQVSADCWVYFLVVRSLHCLIELPVWVPIT